MIPDARARDRRQCEVPSYMRVSDPWLLCVLDDIDSCTPQRGQTGSVSVKIRVVSSIRLR